MDIKLMPEKYKEPLASDKSKIAVGENVSRISHQISAKANLWLTFALVILSLSLLVSGGLFFYKWKLTKEKNETEQRISQLNSQRNLDLETNFIELKKSIENFKKVLQIHIYPSQLFKAIEELTLPKVQLTEFNADLTKAQLKVQLETVDYLTLAKQLFVLEQDPRIKKVRASEAALETSGRIATELEMEFDPAFLQTSQ